jgi:opacity protein-like surface antigen
MRNGAARLAIGMGTAVSMLGFAGAAPAAELYLTPAVGYVGGFLDTKGSKFGLLFEGKPSDWTPGGALALGISVPMNEIAPFDVGLPDWPIRFEIEVLQTADDLDGQFSALPAPINSSVTAAVETTLTEFGLWMDFPVTDGVAAIMGRRVRAFDPIFFLMGGGPGFARSEFDVRHGVDRRKKESIDFAWSAGAGFGYRLTDRIALTATYRYADLGRVDATTCCTLPDPSDFHRIDTEQHQVYFGARVFFYAVSSPNRWYGRW